MDGVIADTEPLNAQASIHVLEDLFQLKHVQPTDFAAGIGRGAEAYMQAAAEAHGRTLSQPELQQAVAARQSCLLQMLSLDPLPAFPGVQTLMDTALAAPEWGVAIATGSTHEKAIAVLRAARIPYERMVLITGSEPHARKPAPDMFLAAATKLEIPTARCIVIEDSISGVQAAKRAGAKCVAVTNSFPRRQLMEADLIVDSLTALSLPILYKLLQPGPLGNPDKDA